MAQPLVVQCVQVSWAGLTLVGVVTFITVQHRVQDPQPLMTHWFRR